MPVVRAPISYNAKMPITLQTHKVTHVLLCTGRTPRISYSYNEWYKKCVSWAVFFMQKLLKLSKAQWFCLRLSVNVITTPLLCHKNNKRPKNHLIQFTFKHPSKQIELSRHIKSTKKSASARWLSATSTTTRFPSKLFLTYTPSPFRRAGID